MRKALCVVALAAACTGCGKNPVGPEPVEVRKQLQEVAQLTATDENGDVWYVCETKPRQYVKVNPDGSTTSTWEVDRYLSKTPCPVTPID